MIIEVTREDLEFLIRAVEHSVTYQVDKRSEMVGTEEYEEDIVEYNYNIQYLRAMLSVLGGYIDSMGPVLS